MAKKAAEKLDSDVPAEGDKGETLHKRALARYKVLDDYWQENLKLALEDIKFRAGDEWPDDIKRKREDSKRPCLTFRRGEQYIRQVVNDGRQNRPAIKYRPIDSGSDVKVAKAFMGLARDIQAKSNADDAYDTSLDCAVGSGFGYFRVLTEYAHEASFDQEIRIKRIANPLSVRLAPHNSADGADSEDGFVIDSISREAYKRTYPNAKFADWKADEDKYHDGWLDSLNVRIAEYFYKVATQTMIYALADGQTIKQGDYENLLAKGAQDIPGIVNKRTVRDVKVMWVKLSGAEVLEGPQEFPCPYIPIVPVYGVERNINGKTIYEGMIRIGKGPLQLYNFERTAYAERVAMTPKAPYVAAVGQLEDRDEWETANEENHPYLAYNPIDVNGTPVPPPRREQAADIPSHYAQSIQITSGDIQAAFGMFNASIGAPSNEKSGKAILARQREGDVSTFHYHDNLARAVKHLGRILLAMIPRVYDTKRTIRMLEEDGTEQIAMIDPDLPSARANVDGMEVFNLNAGRFDVDVSTGPSYSTKRQEDAAAQIEIAQANPTVWNTHGDLIVKSQDWHGAEEWAERTKALMPPELKAAIAQAESGDDEEGPSPEVRAIMEQAQQAVQQRDEALQQMQAQMADLQKAADDKAGDRDIKAKEVAVKRYEAETTRLKELLPALTPEQAAFLIAQTMQQVQTPLDLDLDPAALVMNQQAQQIQMAEPGPMN